MSSPPAPEEQEDEFARVFAFVRTIPRGRVLSYGEVGRAVGVTAREAGWALRWAPPDIPWQRVVGADGQLRTSKRAPELAARQRALLEAEGVAFDDKGCVEREYFWS